jgi:hypothetical protein
MLHLIGFCLTCKKPTRLERFARFKQSSLLKIFVNYDRKFFIYQWPGCQGCTTFFFLTDPLDK